MLQSIRYRLYLTVRGTPNTTQRKEKKMNCIEMIIERIKTGTWGNSTKAPLYELTGGPMNSRQQLQPVLIVSEHGVDLDSDHPNGTRCYDGLVFDIPANAGRTLIVDTLGGKRFQKLITDLQATLADPDGGVVVWIYPAEWFQMDD